LHVTVDVETIVFACQDDRAVVKECNIETLGVFDLRFERRDELPVLSENGQVEVVVIVGDEDFAGRVDAYANWVVGETFAADLAQEDALVAEYLDTVSTVVGNEDLLLVVNHDAVGELQMLRAAKLVQYVAHLIENDDAHHLALDDDDPSLRVNRDTAWML